MNLVDYIKGLVNAALGKGSEGFTDSTTPQSLGAAIQNLYSSLPILLILHTTMLIVYGTGAARLSYCYQMSTNASSPLFYLYIVLAFIFSPMYYPYYGIVLNPVCGKTR
jgi:hypothetical protein